MNWYFSDPHFFHDNMAKHRQFSSSQEMNDAIIDGINSKCTKKDDLYCLGDVFWKGKFDDIKQFLKLINFRKLIFVKGNHDKPLLKFFQYSKDDRLELYNDLIIKDSGYTLHLYHYPIFDWYKRYHNKNGYKYLMLHGHQHRDQDGKLMKIKGAINVNVDMNNYIPLNINDIIEIVKNQE